MRSSLSWPWLFDHGLVLLICWLEPGAAHKLQQWQEKLQMLPDGSNEVKLEFHERGRSAHAYDLCNLLQESHKSCAIKMSATEDLVLLVEHRHGLVSDLLAGSKQWWFSAYPMATESLR